MNPRNQNPPGTRPLISIIAAVAQNGVIGKGGALPWRLPEDLKRFKRLTTGHPIIMGRRTWEEVGKPLPGRTNIVLTRRGELSPQPPEPLVGVIVVQSLEEGIEKARKIDPDEVFIIGGAAVYAAALPVADRIYLTRVLAKLDGDTIWEPKLPAEEWCMVSEELHEADGEHAHSFRFEVWERGK